MKDDEGLQDEVKKVNTMPLHLGAFELANSKRFMNSFIHAIGGVLHKGCLLYRYPQFIHREQTMGKIR